MIFLILLTILLHFFTCVSGGLIGFDCSHQGINITTIATDYVPGCKIEEQTIEPTEEVIQLVQIADKYPLHVYQCKILVLRDIKYCGMHSHSSSVSGGLAQYLRSITKHECLEIHRYKAFRIGDVLIDNLQSNSSTSRSVLLAGTVTNTGACNGGSYSDLYGTWSNVIVQSVITITLNDYTASADTSSDIISLRSGLSCTSSIGECVDTELGYTTWETDPISKCDPRKHMVLYEGVSKVYTSVGENGQKIKTYIVDGSEKIFGLRTISTYPSCMFKAYKTEHPKLIIIPKTNHEFYFELKALHPASMDLMAYVNTKFVYVDKIYTRNMNDLYLLLETQRCAIERRTLQTLLSLAIINPQEFAYTYMGQSGYTALRLGEVIHLIKCIPVDVTIRPSQKCYHELPVTYSNRSMFLTPRSRLLQMYGTQVDCDNIVNAQFRIGDTWYAISRDRHPVPAPEELSPQPITKRQLQSIEGLASTGIYTYEESEKLRARVMNPYEREAINNIITRGVSGKSFDRQGISLTQLVDDNMIESVGDKISRKVWKFLSAFGNFSAGLIGLYMVGRAIKFICDTFIHGKLLYEIYGFSILLVGSIWDSLTTYLMHRGQSNVKKTQEQHGLGNLDKVISQDLNSPESTVLLPQQCTSSQELPRSCTDGKHTAEVSCEYQKKDHVVSIYPKLPSQYNMP